MRLLVAGLFVFCSHGFAIAQDPVPAAAKPKVTIKQEKGRYTEDNNSLLSLAFRVNPGACVVDQNVGGRHY